MQLQQLAYAPMDYVQGIGQIKLIGQPLVRCPQCVMRKNACHTNFTMLQMLKGEFIS